MTLREFFDLLAQNPILLLFYFGILPFTALLARWLGSEEGHLPPWKYLYSVLIYLICVPGVFAVTLSVYLFLFERRSIFDTDIYTQIIPVISMLLTLFLIRSNVDLDRIPGFQKLSGLITMIAATLVFMWFIDRTRIYVFSYLPMSQVLLIFVVLFLVIRFGWSRFFGGTKQVG